MCCERGIPALKLRVMRCLPTSVVRTIIAGLCGLAATALPQAAPRAGSVDLPPALIADGIPPIPRHLEQRAQPYLDYRATRFFGWHPRRGSVLVGMRLDASLQLHEVAAPGAPRRQLSFGAEPILGGDFSPVAGDVAVALADTGGDEQYQIYRVEAGKMQRLTTGKGLNLGLRWTADGRQIGYSTTVRTGVDTDLHMMDPRDPATDRQVMLGRGGGWSFMDFSADGKRALLYNYLSVAQSSLYELDFSTGIARPLMPPSTDIMSFGSALYAPGDRIFAITDQASEHRYIAEIDPTTGIPRRLNPETGWSVDEFDIDPGGKFLAYTLNVNGASKLRLLDLATGKPRAGPELVDGIVNGLEIAPWGEIGFSMSNARSPGDVYSLNPDTLKLTRWTRGETGGLDPEANALPELVTVKSFDGLRLSGFLYRPDARRFPGARPLIISFHGGPEGQSRPGHLGRGNYLLNELGIALFFPNVRGSTGYGKSFVALDNGPGRRENSVRDLGAFLKRLERDPAIDRRRMAVTGGSYGGYMTLAALIRYPKKFRAGVSIVGISNFVSFLERTRGYRRDLRRIEYGDERIPSQRRKLEAISPLTRADRIRVPLMAVTGANDPRVPPSEADQIVAAVRARQGEAWHLVAADEGHGFGKKPNADYQFLATVLFWERFLLEKGEGPRAASR